MSSKALWDKYLGTRYLRTSEETKRCSTPLEWGERGWAGHGGDEPREGDRH